jgi:hypothetical protein
MKARNRASETIAARKRREAVMRYGPLSESSRRPVYAGGFAGLQCESAEALAKAGTPDPITTGLA